MSLLQAADVAGNRLSRNRAQTPPRERDCLGGVFARFAIMSSVETAATGFNDSVGRSRQPWTTNRIRSGALLSLLESYPPEVLSPFLERVEVLALNVRRSRCQQRDAPLEQLDASSIDSVLSNGHLLAMILEYDGSLAMGHVSIFDYACRMRALQDH
ncbi:hypothetical protein THAOC_06174 [Thalassiosira oceanica]|uniref:Uncharacterized protein n=1 Tax=Thalassiosira oceanica TaxID=159749 RepID=K0T3M3_THAOC|nr:hypothetical protein THAOC_06174 [Thalassiosira oceanica]|eukprot:EJK72305.1 hypothetical protein THAOC_06174 [Thalassiosira oceanica]